MLTTASTVPTGRQIFIKHAGVCEIRTGLGEARWVNQLAADSALHQPLGPVVAVADVTGPLVLDVTQATDLTGRLAGQHRLSHSNNTLTQAIAVLFALNHSTLG